MFSDQEKIKLIEEAFREFMSTVMQALAEQRVLFEKVLKRTEEKKIGEHREKIKEMYSSRNNNNNTPTN